MEGFYLSVSQAPKSKNYSYTEAFDCDEFVYNVRATYDGTTLVSVFCPEEDLVNVIALALALKDALAAAILRAEVDWQRREAEREANEAFTEAGE